MMPDPLGIIQGNSHTFKFITPGNASEPAITHVYYSQFY